MKLWLAVILSCLLLCSCNSNLPTSKPEAKETVSIGDLLKPTPVSTPYKAPKTLTFLAASNIRLDRQFEYPKELKPAIKYYQQKEYDKAAKELKKVLSNSCNAEKGNAASLFCLLPLKYWGELIDHQTGKLIYISPYQGNGAFKTLEIRTPSGKISGFITSAGRMRVEENIKLGEQVNISHYEDDFLLIKKSGK